MKSKLNPDETVGYTQDGEVFFSMIVQDPDGRPMNIMMIWEPKRAMQIADWLMTAAREVKPKSIIIGAYG
jgi:hypothetical protein